MLFNVVSRKVAYFVLIGFLFEIGWQIYNFDSEKLDGMLMSSLTVSASTNSNSAISDKIRTGNVGEQISTTGIALQLIKTTSAVLKSTNERYELIDMYAKDVPLKVEPTRFKRILLWNEAFYGSKNFGIGNGRDVFREFGCPVWQCESSENRSDVQEYDAVIFNLRGWKPDNVPQRRSPQQRYVFWSWESPVWKIYGDDTSEMGHFFNWTMTYRWDSDMVSPYGYITPNGNVPLHPSEDQMKLYLSSSNNSSLTKNYSQGKTKMAAWFVSHCNSQMSRRNEMVSILQNYIQVDVYGTCGNMTCPKKQDKSFESSEECRDMVAQKYKFYFSLENSMCRDYVTEKFFAMLHRPVLPVVFGLHDDHEKLAPSHSFINGAKFKDMKALADHLMLLDKNDTLYNEYFWWKPHFQVRDSQKDKNQGMCHLCASLHDVTLPRKTYADFSDWWQTQAECQIPKISNNL